MKKIMLLAAFGVAGLVSAKTGETINLKESEKIKESAQRICSQWYTVEAPCGAVYYLCGNNYWSVQEMHVAME